jgi:hypothetical protein
MSPLGVAMVSWTSASAGGVLAEAAVAPAGQGFLPPAPVSRAGQVAAQAAGAVTPEGSLLLMWLRALGSPASESLTATVQAATGLAEPDPDAPPVMADLRVRPPRLTATRPAVMRFSLSRSAPVRVRVTTPSGGREVARTVIRGLPGTNRLRLGPRIGGTTLAPGRWLLTARPAGGVPRQVVVVVPR